MKTSTWSLFAGAALAVLAVPVAILAGEAAGPAAADHVLDLGSTVREKADFSAVFVEDRRHLSIVELTGDYGRELPGGDLNTAPRQAVARAFFASHPDVYDFLVVFTTFEFETGSAQAFHVGIANDVQGIGLPIFDNSAAYGSEGRLASYVDMAALTRYELSPLAAGFESSLATLAHEMMHRWGARVEGGLGDLMLSTDRAHWSFWLETGASVMYGNDWSDNGDGTFTSVGVSRFFSPLDLYLAGFLSPDEVPPFFVLDGPEAGRDRRFELGATVSAGALPLTVDDVIDANGPRVPAAAESQRDFRAAFVLLVRPGETPGEDAVIGLERLRDAFLVRFPILTGGRATLEVHPQAASENGPGVPDPVPGGDPRTGESSLGDALAWLAARQTAGGFWQDTESTRPRDTARALEVLSAYDPAFAGSPPALAWLSALEDSSTDFQARAARTLESFGADVAPRRSSLLASQNADGGWGAGAGFASDPLDTVLAVRALHGRPGVDAGAVDRAAQYLLATQAADGGWGNHAGGASRTGVTAGVVAALTELGAAPPEALSAAVSFLASRQNADGGFGDSPSTAHDTAGALLTLLAADALAAIDADSAVLYLGSRQTDSGSWEGSVHTTALVVDALKRAARRPNWRADGLTAEPASVADGERVRLTLEIENDGGALAPEGLVRFYDGDPGGGAAVFDEVPVPPLPAGGRATVTARWESLDLAGAHNLYAAVDPEQAFEEQSETDNVASAAVEVRPAPDGVDLTVGPADVAVFPSDPDRLPAELAVSAVVANVGRTHAGSVGVALWRGTPENGTRVAEVAVVLAGRSTAAANFVVELEEPGTTVFTVELDPDSEVVEDDEANNRASVSVTTRPA